MDRAFIPGIDLNVKHIKYRLYSAIIIMKVYISSLKNIFNITVMKGMISLLFSFVITVSAFSQFNDTTNYFVSYASSGVINKTREQSSFVLTNALKFNINKKNLSLNSGATWNYGQQQGNLTNNDFSSILDFGLFKNQRRLYYWGLAGYDRSFSLKINGRVQSGLGVAYNVTDTTNAWLNISDGILYERSDLNITPTDRKVDYTFRNSLRIRYRWVIREIIILDGTNFLQNALRDRKDYIIKSNNSLSVKLRKWLSISGSVNYNKLTRTNRENLLITYGLLMEKYF